MAPEAGLGSVERRLRTVGLLLGPLLAALVFAVNPGDHPAEGRRLLAVFALVIAWWVTEAIPLPATALVGSALAIAAGVAPAREVLAPYADPVIFLFLGTFLLAEAFRKYGLDRRVAAALLGLRVFAHSARGLLAGFGVVSATLSSVLSNTATAALLTPVATGALDSRTRTEEEEKEAAPPRLDSGVLLMIAYGASIGGLATLIGTPPNLLVAGFLERLAGVHVTFTGWLAFALPISVAMGFSALGIVRLTLGRGLHRTEALRTPSLLGRSADPEARAGARWTMVAVSLAFLLWTAPAVAGGLLGRDHALARGLSRHFPEAGVALLCAVLLFAAPVRWSARRFALGWDEARQINWGILLLFGGGLSLGSLAESTGLARWAGDAVVGSGLARSPGGFMLAAIVAALVLTEFASNTASATLLIPVVISAAREAGFDPVPPAIAVGLATTCAFVFPVSTPPNAIVFGTGRVPLTRMIRTGLLLDVLTVAIIWVGVRALDPWLPR